MRKKGSRTAESSAAQRALHARYGREPRVFEDPFALALAGPLWRVLLSSRATAALFRKGFPWLLPMVAHHLVRSRYLEERLDELVAAGLRQYVLLGAGMDSIALRRPDLAPRLTLFEVDHPGTQARKRRRLAALGYADIAHVRYVGMDLEAGALPEALARAGFDDAAPSLFAWMGVVPYLTETAIRSTLRDVAACSATGTEIVLDTLDGAAFTRGRESAVGRKLFRATERMGEPMISGFELARLEALLAAAGLTLREVVTASELGERWLTGRTDLPAPWEHMYLVRAAAG